FLRKGKIMRGSLVLFAGAALVFKLAMTLYVPKVERYTQGAAMDFFKSVQGEDVYIQPVGYKTYGHLFYARMQPQNAPHVADYSIKQEVVEWERWLMYDAIDKPVYFITRIDKADKLPHVPGLEMVLNKNGFVVYKRYPNGQ
ncbi:MAG: hypothetical protein ACK4IY_05950, partial [Chitinophagales bacterium]